MSLDEDMQKAGTEHVLQERSEWSQVIDRFNLDEVDPKTNMSSVDQTANINRWEMMAFAEHDEHERMGLLWWHPGLTRQRKRLSNSVGGHRAEQITRILGSENQARKQGFMGMIADKFGRRP